NGVRPQRSKEQSHDYRYFPDPDLPPLVLSEEFIAQEQAQLPELPAAKRERFMAQYALSVNDADVLTGDRAVADYYEAVVHAGADAKLGANWVINEVLADAKTHEEQLRVPPGALAQLIGLVRGGTLSQQAAKRVFAEVAEHGGEPRNVAEALGVVQVLDSGVVAGWVTEVLGAHPHEVVRYKQGETKLMPFFVGQVMKVSRGKADPKLAQHLHHILGRHRHVARHVVVGKVPPCILEDHLERPTPALALGQVHHPAEQPATGPDAEQRGRNDGVEMRVARRVILEDQLLRLFRVGVAQVGLEAALPVAVAQGSGTRREDQLTGHEKVVGHGVGCQVREVAEPEGAQRIGRREIEDLLAHVPGVTVPPDRGVLLREGGVGRDVAVQVVVGE